MQWVELKMKELGVLSNPDYKITCLMDCLVRIAPAPTLVARLVPSTPVAARYSDVAMPCARSP